MSGEAAGMMNVKILGAGSIGNHLSNAARQLGWTVTLCDVDPAALRRTRDEIYPARYGAFDPAIRLVTVDEAPRGGFDLICIGTPPDNHVELALAALAEAPRAILIEKPVCRPDLDRAQELHDMAAAAGVPVFVGYDHVVGAAAQAAATAFADDVAGPLTTLDVEFREYWGGIFAAHPWLDGPHDSYLGYWRRGGGASGEHSHAINLWQHFAHTAGAGRVTAVTATLDYVRDGRVDYDRLCLLNLETENGLVGRTVQDVVTQPPRKWARLQGETGAIEWQCGFAPGCDAVTRAPAGSDAATERFEKTRPDDFIQELRHIADAMAAPERFLDLSLARGLDTMLVVAAAHRSAELGRTIRIDHDAGWTPDALQPA
jgi:predicted dehydrogenase